MGCTSAEVCTGVLPNDQAAAAGDSLAGGFAAVGIFPTAAPIRILRRLRLACRRIGSVIRILLGLMPLVIHMVMLSLLRPRFHIGLRHMIYAVALIGEKTSGIFPRLHTALAIPAKTRAVFQFLLTYRTNITHLVFPLFRHLIPPENPPSAALQPAGRLQTTL